MGRPATVVVRGHQHWSDVAAKHAEAVRLGRRQEAAYWLTIALKLIQQEGRAPSVAEIAKLIGRRQATVRRIVHRYNERGPEGFLPSRPVPPRKPGRKPSLTPLQVERVQMLLATEPPSHSDSWTAEAVRREVKRRFRVEISRSTAWRYMKRARSSDQASLFDEVDGAPGRE